MSIDPRVILNVLPTRAAVNEALGRIDQLEAVEAWALGHLPVHAGDPVTVDHVQPAGTVWRGYTECLRPGAGAVVTGLTFAVGHGWLADIVLDREWSLSEQRDDGTVDRWWNGPGDPPDGYRDGRRGHTDRRHTFTLALDQLRRADPQPVQAVA